MLHPLGRALAQIDDPAFLRVILASAACSALGFLLLAAAIGWPIHLALAEHGWLAWLGPVVGGLLAALAALLLFLPVAAAIASLFVETVAQAVEARWYPAMPPGRPASFAEQAIDGLGLGVRLLLWQCLAALLALLLPGLGALLGWAIAAWGVGRGLFLAVAMRRMDRARATALYRARRPAVLAQGAIIAACGMVPVLNLFAAVLGVAAMVHVLHRRVVHNI